ncbi:arginine N methyltransferase [Trypanosoma vivax]|nr:arginine N-methyltransferase [Trypanosoma vivax]KAH8604056.1 arginine N methyltransferase [Trypanosoma vivax]
MDKEKTPASSTTDYYFDSYSHYGIHMEMLKDYHRTTSYRDAIWRNAYLFKGKVVLDVGCGTGILSMFAAKAGARKVIGVDCSNIAVQARQIVKDNGLDNVITIIQGKVEDLQLDEKVDIIISEWMGYFLLYESMLNTVLYARDRWGVPGVRLLPDAANMYVCGINDEQYMHENFNVWENVQGIDFSYFKRLSYIEPLVDTVERQQIVTNTAKLVSFDINTVKEVDLSFTAEFTLVAGQTGKGGHKSHSAPPPYNNNARACNNTGNNGGRTSEHNNSANVMRVDALCVYFDTPFTAGHEIVVLTTTPYASATHWRQTVLYLFNALHMQAGEQATFQMSCRPNERNPRDLDIALRVDFEGELQSSHYSQDFRLR